MHEGTDPDSRRPLFRVCFYNETDTPSQTQLSFTSSSADLTIFITSDTTSSLRTSFLRPITIRIVYNQILFSPRRIEYLLSQINTILFEATVGGEPTKAVGMIPLTDTSSDSPLPDPTSELHWSLWRGAITDIFATNAAAHPNRSCVIESSDVGSTTTFTYQHIHYASNLVAHYLINQGIRREDVVMIYAYRGVDLVVAIMGVLKAGATFSVIGKSSGKTEQKTECSLMSPPLLQ